MYIKISETTVESFFKTYLLFLANPVPPQTQVASFLTLTIVFIEVSVPKHYDYVFRAKAVWAGKIWKALKMDKHESKL